MGFKLAEMMNATIKLLLWAPLLLSLGSQKSKTFQPVPTIEPLSFECCTSGAQMGSTFRSFGRFGRELCCANLCSQVVGELQWPLILVSVSRLAVSSIFVSRQCGSLFEAHVELESISAIGGRAEPAATRIRANTTSYAPESDSEFWRP